MTAEVGNLDRARRALLKAGAGGASALLAQSLLPTLAFGQSADPRVARILADTISVDMHNHDGQPPFAKTPADARPDPAGVDLRGQMRRSGMSAICLTYVVDSYRTPQKGDWYQYHLQCLAYDDRLLASSGIRRALTVADLKAAHASKTPIVIQSSEGAQWIEGRLERIEEAYKRGLRHLQLLHSLHDLAAPFGGLQSQFGGAGRAAASPAVTGLTAFGAEVIRECNRLGIVVDMAHANQETLTGALKASRQPLCVTHTALDTPLSRTDDIYIGQPNLVARLVSKSYAKAVADAGGIIGIWRLFPTLKDYVTAIRQMVDVVGADHVGIGTDSSMAPAPGAPPPATGPSGAPIGGSRASGGTNDMWPDEKNGFLNAILQEMLAQGFNPAEISKIIGGNYVRVFGAATRSGA